MWEFHVAEEEVVERLVHLAQPGRDTSKAFSHARLLGIRKVERCNVGFDKGSADVGLGTENREEARVAVEALGEVVHARDVR